MTSPPKFELIPIEQIHQDPANLRHHPEENARVVGRSLSDLGMVRPVVVDENNQLIAGNQTTESAMQEGFTQALVVETAGNVLVVHRRTDLTPEQKIKAAFLDNHSSDVSFFDDARVGLALHSFPDAFDIISEADKRRYLLAAGSEAGKRMLREDEGGKMDQAAPLAVQWQIAPGQIWRIPSLSVPGGEHRLALGDSRDPALAARLIAGQPVRALIFDPPYGVDYADKNAMLNRLDLNAERGHRTRLEIPIEGDKMTPEEIEAFVRTILQVSERHTEPGAAVYITGPSGNLIGRFLAAFEGTQYQFKQTLIWVKNNFVLGTQDYHYRHEHVFYGHKRGTRYWCGSRSLDSVIELDMPRSAKLHPTMKPPELFEFFLQNSTQPGDIAWDPTAGSGTLLVSAERQGRLARLGELCTPTNLGYGGVILQRAADLGLVPVQEGARGQND